MATLLRVVAVSFAMGAALGTALFSTGMLDRRARPVATASMLPPAKTAAVPVGRQRETESTLTAADDRGVDVTSAVRQSNALSRQRHREHNRFRAARNAGIDRRHTSNF